MMKTQLIWLSLLAMLAMLAANAQAADIWAGSTSHLNTPQKVVKDTMDKMVNALNENRDAYTQEPSKTHELINEVLVPVCDFRKMSILALGKNWRKASPEQRDAFVEQFQQLLVRTYSTAVLQFTDQKLSFLPFRGDLSKKRASVPMSVTQSSGQSIKVALSVFENKQTQWKLYDMKIDGISLVTNYRSTFSDKIRQGGIDKLISDLKAENSKAQ